MESLVLRASAIGILCAVAGILLRSVRPDFAGLIRIAGGVLIFGAVAVGVGEAVREAVALFSGNGTESYVTVMLRALGIALLTRICTDLCRDAGESAVASGVELAGKAAILMLCLPLIREVLGYAARILEMDS